MRGRAFVGLLTLVAGLGGRSAGRAQTKRNRLLTGKLIYVGDMPDALDRWIIEDLRGWGKYTPTKESEGADLAMKSYRPEKRTRLALNKYHVPQPKKESRKERNQPIIATIGIVDWVTGQDLWHADIINGKPKNRVAPSAGPRTQIYAHGLSPAELAARITILLRRYVTQLERAPTTPPQ